MARTSPRHSNSWKMCVNAPRSKGPGKARRLPSKALPTSFAKSSHQRCCTPLRRQGPATTNCVSKCRPWSVDHVRRGCSQDKGPFRGLSSLIFLHQSQRRRGKGFGSLPRKEKVKVERTKAVPPNTEAALAATLDEPISIGSCKWVERRLCCSTPAANKSVGPSRNVSAQIRKFVTGGTCASDAALKENHTTTASVCSESSTEIMLQFLKIFIIYRRRRLSLRRLMFPAP